jgi:UDP-glucose 4-epimerase
MGLPGSSFSHGNITPSTNWSEGLLGVDVVIHLAGRAHVLNETEPNPLEIYRQINVASTYNLALQAADMGVKRFIFISTIKVHGEETEIDSPFTENSTYAPASDYAISKMEAEVMLQKVSQDSGMEVVIIRPPLVYGPSVSANFKRLIRLAASGWPLPLGGIRNVRSFVSVNNLTSLVVQCIDHPLAANQAFLVSDGYDVSTSELVENLSNALGVNKVLFRLPACFWTFCSHFPYLRALSHKMTSSLRVDISKAKRLLGWRPPYHFYDEIKLTVEKNII